MKKSRIFTSIWLKLKHFFQDLTILIFLLVLCLFSYTEGNSDRSSQFLDILEILVIVCIGVAIGCEVLLMIYTIYFSVKEALVKVKNNINSSKIVAKTEVDDSDQLTIDVEEELMIAPRNLNRIQLVNLYQGGSNSSKNKTVPKKEQDNSTYKQSSIEIKVDRREVLPVGESLDDQEVGKSLILYFMILIFIQSVKSQNIITRQL